MNWNGNEWLWRSPFFRSSFGFTDREQDSNPLIDLFVCVSCLWTTTIVDRFWKKRGMRRFAVRQRPLQPGKRIRVYHLAVDGSFINENGDRVPANLYDLDDCVSSCSDHPFGISRRLQVAGLQFDMWRSLVSEWMMGSITPFCWLFVFLV